ncbi:putative dual specificity phosphatase 12 [Paratrimastix pyriformis]|uniref:protein-tyrosine-phosphatase n=1 Tax=Paratrimastix pyriformis TaxID=342808 RepID=A0ABQ8UPD9_9EUKA|nr:putative dual specificity phosphatase 12 [Paratrimastix pyriformis]
MDPTTIVRTSLLRESCLLRGRMFNRENEIDAFCDAILAESTPEIRAEIRQLDLSRNDFEGIPQKLIALFPNLDQLDLSRNLLTKVVHPPNLMPHCLVLLMENTDIACLPEDFFHAFPALEVISFACSQKLRTLPASFDDLKHIKTVDLTKCLSLHPRTFPRDLVINPAVELVYCPDDPSEILDGELFLGPRTIAEQPAKLAQMGVSHILNVCTSPNKRKDPRLTYLQLEITDHPLCDISQFFQVAFDFLDAALGRTVSTTPASTTPVSTTTPAAAPASTTPVDLTPPSAAATATATVAIPRDGSTVASPRTRTAVYVHCERGLSRSPTVVVAYLFLRHRDRFPTVTDAWNHVRMRRPCIKPNEGFLKLLWKLGES